MACTIYILTAYAICKILHKDIKDIVVEIKEDEKKQGASDDKV